MRFVKKILSALSIVITTIVSCFAQPPNDDCLTAIAIVIPADGDTCFSSSNLASTNDGSFNGCDVTPAGNQVWFTYTTTGSNNVVTVTPSGGSPMTDAVVTLQAQTACPCGSGCYETCDDATGSGTASASWGYSPGEQVIIQVTSNGTDGDFTLCITSSTPPPSPGNDCANASTLCDFSDFQVSSTSGFSSSGLEPGCFGGAGNQDVWYQFTVGQTGTIEWTASPLGNAEYDWAMFDITSGCPGGMNTPFLCNWNYSNAMGTPVGVGTSCVTCPTDGAVMGTCAEHCASTTVTAGNTYAIIIDNYSANGVGFDFNWGSGNDFLMAPTSVFNVSPSSGCGSITACFTNSSVGAISYAWDFGNGNTSTATNPPCQTYSTPGTYLVSLTTVSSTGCVNVASAPVIVSAGPTVTTTTIDANCGGGCDGQATANSTGANPPFSYAWSSGGSSSTETGLCLGTYIVTVTDTAGCFDTASAVINEPGNMTLTPASTDETCDAACDGTVSVSASGGTTPYTYSWSNGCSSSSCTNLCDGTYNITVTDGAGCINDTFAIVSPGLVVTSNFTYNSNQCLTGNNFCFTNTGSSGATYAWDFGDGTGTSTLENPCYTYATAGSYTVTQTVTIAPCSATTSQSVVVYAEPTASIIGTDVTCNSACDGIANLTPNGGLGPYTFLWSNTSTSEDLSSLCPNTYTVTVTDANGCTATASVVITEPPALSVAPTGTNASCNLVCDGTAAANASGGTGTYTYAWDDPSFQTTSTATGLCAGSVNVTVTDANSCTAIGSYNVTEPPAIVLTTSSVDATCGLSDGSVSVSATDGISPYTYNWSNGCTTSSCGGLASGTYTVTVSDNNGCNSITSASISGGTAGTPSITVNNNATCNTVCDGSATASITGGTSPFTYAWNTSPVQTVALATGLCAGSWSVSITDAGGCVATASTTITEPAALAASITASSGATCNGVCDGSGTVSVSGGTGAYTYSWAPSGGSTAIGTGFCAGTSYTVTVNDENNCSDTTSVTISEPAALNLVIVGTDPLCNSGTDGSADLTVTGGTGAYNYAWSNSTSGQDISSLTAGTYTVTVTDVNSCQDSASVVISEPAALAVTTSITDASCGLANGSACATPAGGISPYTYIWNDPLAQSTTCADSLLGGSYNVTVSDANGCSVTASVTLNDLVGGTPVATVDNNASAFGVCDGQATVTMTGTSPFTYNWNDPGTQTTATATGLCATTFCVTVTDGVGCTGSDCITITEPPAIVTSIVGTSIDCNGNCNATADLTVSGGSTPYTYLWSGPGAFSSAVEDPIGLCAGTYYVTVTDGNSATMVDTLVIIEPLLLTVSVGKTDVICNGGGDGTATATASGGTAPYTYLWDDILSQTTMIANSLCAQSYSVSVTDINGCVGVGNVTINEPLAIGVTVNVTDATCGQPDGAVSAVITNSTAPLTYSWDNGCVTSTCSGLLSGTYNITLTDVNGCIGTGSGTVSDIGGPTAVITGTINVSCFGGSDGSATVSVTDGTPPYTYAWATSPVQTNTTATGLSSGSQNVVITDANGCIVSVSATLTEPAELIAVISTQINPSCTGFADGIIATTVTGGIGPYTYSWTNGCTTSSCSGLGAGSYTVDVTDANFCTVTVGGSLTDPLPLVLNVTSTDVSCFGFCNGSANVVVAGGTTPYTYSWSNGDNGQNTDSLCNGSYTVTVTDNKGCTASSSATITEPAQIVVTIPTSGDVLCNGNCNGFAQSSATGGTSPYTYLWNTNDTNSQITNVCPGIYVVVITDNNGCSGTENIKINEPDAISLNITSTNVTCYNYCDGVANSVVTGGTGSYIYQWNDNNFQTTATATGLCDSVYTLVVTDVNGCSNSSFTNITQPQLLGITATTTSSTCGNPNGSASVVISGGLVPYTFVWNDPNVTQGISLDSVLAGVYDGCLIDGNGCNACTLVVIDDITGPTIDSVSTSDLACFGDANGTGQVYTSSGTAPFTYYWKNNIGDTIGINSNVIFGLSGGIHSISIRDANNCLSSLTFFINEPNPMTSAIISLTDASCAGSCDGSATIVVADGTLPYTYSWAPSGDTTDVANGLCAGLNNVAVTDGNGCQITDGDTIGEPAPIVLTNTINNPTCSGNNDGTITANVTGGTLPYTYVWLPAGTGGNNPSVSGITAGTYSIQVFDIKGCTSIDNIIVTEPDPLTAVDGSDPSTCSDANGVAWITASGGTSPYSYSWTDILGFPIGQTGDSAFGLIDDYYVCIISDGNNCTYSDTISVGDYTGPQLSLGPIVDALCVGTATGTATVIGTGGTPQLTYQWDDLNLQTTQTATGLPADTFTVIVSDYFNCQDTVTVVVLDPVPLTIQANGNSPICQTQSTLITTIVGGDASPFSYSWSDTGIPDVDQYSVSPTTSTTYTITVTDTNGCQATDALTIIVHPPLNVIGIGDVICEGENATVTALGTGGDIANYTYTWFNTGITSDQMTVIGLQQPDTFFVMILNDGNCSPNDTDTVSVIINEIPLAPVALVDAAYCLGDPVANLTASGSNIQWYSDNSLTNILGTDTFLTISPIVGVNTYYATQTVNNCESAADDVSITIYALPDAGLTVFPHIAPITNAGIVFTNSSSSDAVSWLLDFGDGGPIDNILDFGTNDTVHFYQEPGTYVVTLEVSNAFGCTDITIDTVEITYEYILFTPAAFTPGNDGINDYFYPQGIGINDDIFGFYVFDRWGDNIYQYEGSYSEWAGWDGKANNGSKIAQADVYVWLIKTEDKNGDPHEYLGHVTLIR